MIKKSNQVPRELISVRMIFFTFLVFMSSSCFSQSQQPQTDRFIHLIQSDVSEGLINQKEIDAYIKNNPKKAIKLITNAFILNSIKNLEIKRHLAYKLANLTHKNLNKALLTSLQRESDIEVVVYAAESLLCSFPVEVENLVYTVSQSFESESKSDSTSLANRNILNRLLAIINSDRSRHHLFKVIQDYEGSTGWLMREGYQLLGDIKYKPAASFLRRISIDKSRLLETRLKAMSNVIKLDVYNKEQLQRDFESLEKDASEEYEKDYKSWPYSELERIGESIRRGATQPALLNINCK